MASISQKYNNLYTNCSSTPNNLYDEQNLCSMLSEFFSKTSMKNNNPREQNEGKKMNFLESEIYWKWFVFIGKW